MNPDLTEEQAAALAATVRPGSNPIPPGTKPEPPPNPPKVQTEDDGPLSRMDAVREALSRSSDGVVGFQYRVRIWMLQCFGKRIASDRVERNHRFLEESLELVQACGCTASEAHQLVDYVFGRPVGEKGQEVGGVEVTLAALCDAHGINKQAEAVRELERINRPEIIEKIRAKQAAKPKHSPLPEEPSRYAGRNEDDGAPE